jgi:hypothetical protein
MVELAGLQIWVKLFETHNLAAETYVIWNKTESSEAVAVSY